MKSVFDFLFLYLITLRTMITFVVHPSPLKGNLCVPPSKSQTLRALLFASLAHGRSTIFDPLSSPDSDAMVNACRLFGAEITVLKGKVEVTGVGGKVKPILETIEVGNSGIVLRFCTAVASLSEHPVKVTGDASIRNQRTMAPLLSALTQLGVKHEPLAIPGYAPLIVKGPLQPGRAKLDGTDSQPVSAMLIAAALASGPVTIDVVNPGEKPWVDLTVHWLESMKVPVERDGYNRFHLKGGAVFEGFHYRVPGDLSTAAFPIAAALVTGSELTIENVDLDDPQGDKKLIELWRQMGARFEVDAEKKSVKVLPAGCLQGIEADLNDCIDAITILAVVACYAEGTTTISNVANARNKECNRLRAITMELSKMGADIVETEDGLKIVGGMLAGASVDSHHDHRMALSLAVAALGAKGVSEICNAACVIKTYPDFAEAFQSIGARIEEKR